MKRKKLKQIIALSLAITSFNFATSSSIPVLAAIFESNTALSTQANYNTYLYGELNNKNIYTTLPKQAETDTTNLSGKTEDLSALFKVKYSKGENNTLIDSSSGILPLPSNTSLFNKFELVISPSEEIEILYIKMGTEPIKSYKDITKDSLTILKDMALTTTTKFDVFIKYKDSTDLVTQKFSATTSIATIDKSSSQYVIEKNTLYNVVKWSEDNSNGFLNGELDYKKVFYKNTFYDVTSQEVEGTLYYESKIKLEDTDIDSSDKPVIYTCDKLFQPKSLSVSYDRSNSITNSVIPITAGTNEDFQETGNILHYGSNKPFTISTSFNQKSTPGETLTIDSKKLKVTSTSQDGKNSTKPLEFKVSTDKKSFTIDNTLEGNNIIRIIYTDENSHLYTQKLSTTIDTSDCSVTPPISGQDVYSKTTAGSSLKLNLTDPYSTTDNTKILPLNTAEGPTTPSSSTLYYIMKNSDGTVMDLDESLISKGINTDTNTLDLDFLPAIKSVPLFVDGLYTLEYLYFNSVGASSIPDGSSDLLETYKFTIDNTLPEISSPTLDDLIQKDNKYYFNNTNKTNIDIKFKDTNLNSELTFTSNLDDMVDSKNKVFYKLTQENVVKNNLVTLNKDKSALNLDLSNTTNFTEGTYKLDVTVSDSAGNQSSKTYDFVIDKTAPEISSVSLDALTPKDEIYYFNDTSTTNNIDINFTDPNLNLSAIDFAPNLDNMDGSTNKVFYELTQDQVVKNNLVALNKDNNALNLDLSNPTNFTEGKYKLDVTAFDVLGNKSVKTYSFTIDKTKPIAAEPITSGVKNEIMANEHSFSVYKDSLLIKASIFPEYPEYFQFPKGISTDLLLQPKTGSTDIKDFNVTIKKLNSYDDTDTQDVKTLTAKDSAYVIDKEGFYQIKYTFTDKADNTSTEKTTYVAVEKETPTVNLLYLDDNGNSIAPVNGSYFSKAITPYLELNDSSFTDENNKPKIDFSLTTSYYIDSVLKTDTYDSTNLISSDFLPGGKRVYGKSYYYVGKSEDNTITRLALKDVTAFSSCTVTNNLGEEIKYADKSLSIEVTDPKIDVKLNGTAAAESSIVFINNSEKPEFNIKVTDGIAGVKETPTYSIKNDSKNITSQFKLSAPTAKDNTSNYTLTYTGDLKDLDKYNGYYTFTFKYLSNTGKEQIVTRDFVLDTDSPSYILSFNDSEDSLSNGEKQVVDDKLTIDAHNSDKLSASGTKKIYCSYDDLYLTIELLDNSFDENDPNFKDLQTNLFSKINITLNNEVIKIDPDNKKILLGKEYFTQDKIYKLNISSSDKSSNTTSRDLDIIVDRSAPTVTFGVSDENNKAIGGTNVDGTYYFNQKIKPYINVSDTICNKDELKYSVTINNNLYIKEYTVTNLNEKQLKATLEALGNGSYNIKVKVTDFAGNSPSSILGNFNYSSTEGVNLVVDTTTPTADLNVFKNDSFAPLGDYIDAESKIYVVVNNEPYFDVAKFKKSIKVTGSNVISGGDNLASMDNIIVADVTESMKDKASNANPTTRVFEISDNNNNFTNGYYKLNYALTDYSGNTTDNKEANFLIDNTDITVTNNFDYNNKYFNSTYDFSVDIPSHYSGYKSSSIKLLKNGEDVTSSYVTDNFNNSMNGGKIDVSVPLSDADKSTEGTYSFEVTLTDYTNKEFKYSTPFKFIMDRTPIELTDFNFDLGNGQLKDDIYYTNSENIDMNFVLDSDLSTEDMDKRTVTINGNQVPSYNNEISNDYFAQDGKYNIVVSLHDKAGNTSSYERNIIVDRTAAEVSLNGFDGVIDGADNKLYINKIITPNIIVNDNFGENQLRRTSYLNNSVYTSSEISENGSHTYSVKVWDLAGNESTKSISFVLDTVKPDITVNDVIDGKFYNTDVKPTYSTPDTTAVLTAYLNDSPYDGSTITGDSNYTLKLVCIDKAQNITEVVYNFVIDTVAPNIDISGINENEINGVITPILKVDDPLSDVMAILNGEYYYGGAITESGKYTLLVKAMDKAGNISERIISFIVDADVPQIFVSNIENGKLYIDEIEPHITVTKEATLTLLLNGEAYDGSKINTPGEYELIINAEDSLGNKNTAVYRFSLAAKGSPEAEGVDSSSDDTKVSLFAKVKDIAPTAGILLGLSALGSLIFTKIKKKIK